MKILLKCQGFHELRKFGNLCPGGLPHRHTPSPEVLFNLQASHSGSCKFYILCVVVNSLTPFIHSTGSYGALDYVPSAVPGKCDARK